MSGVGNFSNWLEAAVISLTLLSQISYWIHRYLKNPSKTGKLVPPPPHGAVINPPPTKLITTDNVEQVFQEISVDLKADTLKWIAVFKCPLSAPFSSSTTRVRGYLQQQLLPFDYHAAVVCKTSAGKFCAVEKQMDGIYVSWSDCKESVLFYFQSESRPQPISLLVADESICSLYDVMHCLRHNAPQNRYDVNRQCQHFAKQLFDKFSVKKFWDMSSPTDFTSPLTLFSDRGSPLFLLLWLATIIQELGLLSSDNIENAASYQFAGFTVLLGLLVLIVLMKTGGKRMFESFLNLVLKLLLWTVVLECILSTPFGAFRKRGALYTEMLKSGSQFYRWWLILCFGTIHVGFICAYLVIIPLQILQVLLKQLSTQVTVLSPVLVTINWFCDFYNNRSVIANYIMWYVLAWFYLSSPS